MFKPKTAHYLPTGSRSPACGQPEGRSATSTRIGEEVTCKACRRSVSFASDFPELATIAKGKPPLSDRGLVSKTIKLSIPPDLLEWLNAQPGTYSDSIVPLLERARSDRSNLKKKGGSHA